MHESVTTLAWVGLTLPILLLVQRWIHRHLRGVAYLVTGRMSWSVVIYALVLFPGVLLHELSHWITARILGVKTGAISLIPRVQADGSLQLGYVEYYKGRSLGPIRESIIGGAPLITGTLVILLIGLRVFDIDAVSGAFASGSVESLTRALGDLFSTPDFLLWLYLIFAVGNAMMPSPSDRRAWPGLLLLLAFLAAFLLILEGRDLLFQGLVGPATTVFGYLGLAFSLIIGVDLAFMGVIYIVEAAISRAKGVELVYEPIETTSSN